MQQWEIQQCEDSTKSWARQSFHEWDTQSLVKKAHQTSVHAQVLTIFLSQMYGQTPVNLANELRSIILPSHVELELMS